MKPLLLATAALALTAASAQAEVARIEIRKVSPAFGGRIFGAVGAYERIEATAHFRIDPNDPANAGIVNIRRAPKGPDGKVAFDSDLIILRPADPAKGSGKLIYEPVNRGNVLILGMLNAAQGRDMTKPEGAGDGFLMTRGYTIVEGGWQTSYPVDGAPSMQVAMASRLGPGVLSARLPIARNPDGSPVTGLTREQFNGAAARTQVVYLAYPAADTTRPGKLLVHRKDGEEPTAVEGIGLRYLDPWRLEVTAEKPEPAAFYDYVYEAKDPVVYGLGLAAMRDVVSFLRYEGGAGNPLARDGKSPIKYAYGFGASQTGRTLKELIYEFPADERGRRIFDGAHINISGAGKNAVNSAFARPGQKDAQPTPNRLHGDEFPFSYPVVYDPISRRTDGVLARCQGTNTCPRILHVDSENELWHGGALTYVGPNGKDLVMPQNVRVYALAGTEHSATATSSGPACQSRSAASIDWSPINRALFDTLDQWVTTGQGPPPSRYPTLASGQLTAPDRTSVGFPNIPGVAYSGAVGRRHLLDFTTEPPATVAPYPVFAPKADADGTMAGGVRHPYVAAPLATHTGWNLRQPDLNLCMASGMSLPFPRTEPERLAKNDPRPAIATRYVDKAAYVAAVTRAANGLAAQRFLSPADAKVIVDGAGARYEAAMGR